MVSAATNFAISLAEKGQVPDTLIRKGIRKACGDRLKELRSTYSCDSVGAHRAFQARLGTSPLAESVDRANEQHYELPPQFFELVLGPRRKYSCCFWSPQSHELGDAEAESLATYCERAEIKDGQSILELGCGWGSLTLHIAENYPNCKIVGVSNSTPQRLAILKAAKSRGLTNCEIVTADINEFQPGMRFDRIVSIEMFEHVRNYQALFQKLNNWLTCDGRLFIHVFRHKDFAYLFEDDGAKNWMGRHFFTGGVMPSHQLLIDMCGPMKFVKDWTWDGTHYEKTSNAWLRNMDQNRQAVERIFEGHYGPQAAAVWFGRWRMFFMACAELFGFEDGTQWGVSHYLFRPN